MPNDSLIMQYLRAVHRAPEWVGITEMRCGFGHGKKSEPRIDFWAINCYPSKHIRRVAYEMKQTRVDFLNELADREKRRAALLVSNQFYFIMPPRVASPDEIPPECGLIEVALQGCHGGVGWSVVRPFLYVQGAKCWHRIVTEAPVRESMTPTWKFVASLLRRDAQAKGLAKEPTLRV